MLNQKFIYLVIFMKVELSLVNAVMLNSMIPNSTILRKDQKFLILNEIGKQIFIL
jgi:hypothetical protein